MLFVILNFCMRVVSVMKQYFMILDRLMDLTSMQWEDLNPCAMVCSSEGHNSPLIQPFPVSFFEVM